ncbi:MAG: DUF2784 domain-containing protein, partial [Patescibacteria group bacterium]|nr:DUF2784 domain-containing protein [Patescibacteria group bacterium]
MYRLLADVIVAFHLAYVAFVVLGLAAIPIGVWRRWSWVRNCWFRMIHLLMITVVAIQAIAGVTCPLTTWEYQLRVAAGDAGHPGTFVGRMVHAVLFFELPHWVFTVGYVGFGAAVLLAFLL